MQSEDGQKLSDEELLKEGLGHVAVGAAFLYEIESDVGKAIAFMVDNVIRYGEHILDGRDSHSSQGFYVYIGNPNNKIEKTKEEVKEVLNKRTTYIPNCS